MLWVSSVAFGSWQVRVGHVMIVVHGIWRAELAACHHKILQKKATEEFVVRKRSCIIFPRASMAALLRPFEVGKKSISMVRVMAEQKRV